LLLVITPGTLAPVYDDQFLQVLLSYFIFTEDKGMIQGKNAHILQPISIFHGMMVANK